MRKPTTFAKLRAQVHAVYSEKDVVSELSSLHKFGSSQYIHGEADQVILRFLDEKHPKVSAAYRELRDKVGFWYA